MRLSGQPFFNRRQRAVGYQGIQFSKTANVLTGMGLGDLGKTEAAEKELADRGMGPQ